MFCVLLPQVVVYRIFLNTHTGRVGIYWKINETLPSCQYGSKKYLLEIE